MKLKIEDADKIFFTADNHFGHANIIQYCSRPFSNVDEMDQFMIDAWNDTVPAHGATVFHLGDLTLGPDAAKYLDCLTGWPICILRNRWHHDKRWLANLLYNDDELTAFSYVVDPMLVLEIEKDDGGPPLFIHLSHYPLREWDRQWYGAWHLHGHCHGNIGVMEWKEMKSANGTINMAWRVDVGVDCWDYAPVSLERLMHNYSLGAKEIEK